MGSCWGGFGHVLQALFFSLEYMSVLRLPLSLMSSASWHSKHTCGDMQDTQTTALCHVDLC